MAVFDAGEACKAASGDSQRLTCLKVNIGEKCKTCRFCDVMSEMAAIIGKSKEVKEKCEDFEVSYL